MQVSQALRALAVVGACLATACAGRDSAGNTSAPSAPAPAGTTTKEKEAVRLYERARQALAGADAVYRRALIASLGSANRYERHLAVERLGVLTHLLDTEVAMDLVPLLAETEKLQSEECAQLIDDLAGRYGGQGMEVERGRCLHQGGTSNGALASKLLRFTLYRTDADRVLDAIVSLVREHPTAVEAVITSLDAFSRSVAYAALKELPKATDSASRAAVLRLAVVAGCGSVSLPGELRPVLDSLRSPDARVRSYAALVLLRTGVCDGNVPALEQDARTAVALLDQRLHDSNDQSITTEVAWLGRAATPLVPALLRRFDAVPTARQDVMKALGAVGPGAAPAVPRLIAPLRDLMGDARLIEPSATSRHWKARR